MHRETIRVRKAVRYLANSEAKCAESRAWRQAHPVEAAALSRQHRVRKAAAAVNDLSGPQWLEIQAAQDHCCAHCERRCKGRLTQDHILALSNGGAHTLHNVIGVCRSCNSKKRTKPSPVLVQPLLLSLAPAKQKRRR